MNKNRIWILFIIAGLLLAACNGDAENDHTEQQAVKITKKKVHNDTKDAKVKQKDEKAEEASDSEPETVAQSNDEPEFEPLETADIKEIVVNNLTEMETKIQEVPEAMPDINGFYMSMTSDILYPEKDTEQTQKPLAITMEKFKHLATDNVINQLVRSYLYAFYVHMEGGHLGPDEIDARFEVLNQTESEFKVRFLSLKYYYTSGGTYTLDYKKKDSSWQLDDYTFTSSKDQPLNLTFEELKAHYKEDFDQDIKMVEERTFEGEEYIIIQIDESHEARNINTADINLELAGEYDDTSDHDVGTLTKKSLESSSTPDITTEPLEDSLDPSDYTAYLGRWTNYTSSEEGYLSVTLEQLDGDQVEIRYSQTAPKGAWINDMWGETTFSPDGIATYDYDENYFGVSGTIKIELKENGVSVSQDGAGEELLVDRVVD